MNPNYYVVGTSLRYLMISYFVMLPNQLQLLFSDFSNFPTRRGCIFDIEMSEIEVRIRHLFTYSCFKKLSILPFTFYLIFHIQDRTACKQVQHVIYGRQQRYLGEAYFLYNPILPRTRF